MIFQIHISYLFCFTFCFLNTPYSVLYIITIVQKPKGTYYFQTFGYFINKTFYFIWSLRMLTRIATSLYSKAFSLISETITCTLMVVILNGMELLEGSRSYITEVSEYKILHLKMKPWRNGYLEAKWEQAINNLYYLAFSRVSIFS